MPPPPVGSSSARSQTSARSAKAAKNKKKVKTSGGKAAKGGSPGKGASGPTLGAVAEEPEVPSAEEQTITEVGAATETSVTVGSAAEIEPVAVSTDPELAKTPHHLLGVSIAGIERLLNGAEFRGMLLKVCATATASPTCHL